MTLRWIVQEDLWNEAGYARLIRALEERDIPHLVVRVRPFIHDTVPPVPPGGSTIVMGWGGFAEKAVKSGWTPGAYVSERLDQRHWQRAYGEHCLNHDSEIGILANVPEDRTLFLRPVLDDKSFAGFVATPEAITSWKEGIRSALAGKREDEQDPTVLPTTIVAWAAPKTILAEHRFFVVGRTVVTGSRYQLAGRSSKRLNNPDREPSVGDPQWLSPDSEVRAFAQRMVDLWSPIDNFVIDVAQTDDGLRVIELGSLNSAGWYESDVAALVDAVETYEAARREEQR